MRQQQRLRERERELEQLPWVRELLRALGFPYLQTIPDHLELLLLLLLRQGLLVRQALLVRLLQGLLHRRNQEPQSPGSMRNHASIDRWRFSKHHRRRCASCGFPGRQPKMPAQKRQLQLRSCSN